MNWSLSSILTHSISITASGLATLASAAVTIGGTVISSMYMKTFATCCTPDTKVTGAWVCANTPPNSAARDAYCSGIDEKGYSWYQSKIAMVGVPVFALACGGAIAHRIRRVSAEQMPISQSAPDSQSLSNKALCVFSSIPPTCASAIACGSALVLTWITSNYVLHNAFDVGQNCVKNATLDLPIWPHTDTNTTMSVRESYCHNKNGEYCSWWDGFLASSSVVVISSLVLGSQAIAWAVLYRRKLRCQHEPLVGDT